MDKRKIALIYFIPPIAPQKLNPMSFLVSTRVQNIHQFNVLNNALPSFS